MLHAPNVHHAFGLLLGCLMVDFLDEHRGQGFQRPYLIRQAQVYGPPVARRRQRGDSVKF